MKEQKHATSNNKQEVFRSMILGTLLYTVVLGFFNDYTNILHTGTYSVTFLLAIVMQILTFFTYMLKDWVVAKLHSFELANQKAVIFGSVWLIVFLSKFVFLGAISVVFSDEVEISGFVGLIIIILCLTITQRLVEFAYQKLGD